MSNSLQSASILILFLIILGTYFWYIRSKNKSYRLQRQINLSHDFSTVNEFLARGKKVLIFAPHQDDEVLMCAGIITHTLANGGEVKIVIVTNGDKKGRKTGLKRIKESIKAIKVLGLSAENIVFLGYGSTEKDIHTSFMNRLYQASAETVIASHVGTQTYSVPEIPEYHYQKFGQHASYTNASLRQDLELVIKEYHPDHIFTASLYDTHPDHFRLYQFIVEAILTTKRIDPLFSPLLHEYLIHSHDGDDYWPVRDAKNSPLVPFTKPATLETNTLMKWENRESFTVPLSMQNVPRSKNKKYQAISQYRSQRPTGNNHYLYSYVKQDEIFWVKDFSNIAFLAEVSVSSENLSTGQLGSKAIDGINGGYPYFPENEWVTQGEATDTWIKLNWPVPYIVYKIVLYDRPNPKESIASATLTFSDGSVLEVGPLATNGQGYAINFTPKIVNWIKLTVDKAIGNNPGLSEFEVYGEKQCE